MIYSYDTAMGKCYLDEFISIDVGKIDTFRHLDDDEFCLRILFQNLIKVDAAFALMIADVNSINHRHYPFTSLTISFTLSCT